MSQPDDFDVDLGAYFHAVARLWWLVVLLAVVGAIAGYGIAKVATRTYSATATVYLGQPTDANGNAVNSVPSNPRAAEQIASGSAVLSQVVSQLHGEIKLGALRRGLTVTVPASAIKSTTTPSNIVSVIVVSRSRKKAADAANAVAQLLVSRLGAYPDAKIALFEQQITATQAQLAATNARLAAAQRQLAASGGGAAAATYLAIVQSASTEQQALQTTLQADKLSLLVARNVESPSVVSAAVASGSSKNAPPTKTSAAGGFVAGIVVALVIAAFTMRRRPRPEPAAA